MSKAARTPLNPFRKLLSLELVLVLVLVSVSAIYDVRTTCMYVMPLPIMLMLDLGSPDFGPKTVKRLRRVAARHLGLIITVFAFAATQRRSEFGRILDLAGLALMIAILATGLMIAKTEWCLKQESP